MLLSSVCLVQVFQLHIIVLKRDWKSLVLKRTRFQVNSEHRVMVIH